MPPPIMNNGPPCPRLILLLCMFLGASAGSTGGGMKCLRVMLCFKYCYKELFSLIHPHAVTHVKIGGKVVPEDVMRSVLGFLALYVGLFAVSSVVLLAGMGVDFITVLQGRRRHHRKHRSGIRHGGTGGKLCRHSPFWGNGCSSGACCWDDWRSTRLSFFWFRNSGGNKGACLKADSQPARPFGVA